MITSDINIVIVSNEQEYAQAMKVRRDVFVDEYHINEKQEFDGNDYSSTHVLALSDDKPVGTMRIRYFNGFVKMERMCVLQDYRKTDVAEQIMQKAMLFSAQKGYDKAYGVCKKELLHRWQKNGFLPIEGAVPVEQNGMQLVPVYCNLPKVDNIITMQTEPQILNAKEGSWFEVEEKSPVFRIKELTNKVKKMKQSADFKCNSGNVLSALSKKADDKSY